MGLIVSAGEMVAVFSQGGEGKGRNHLKLNNSGAVRLRNSTLYLALRSGV